MATYVMAHKRTVGSGKVLADALNATCITPKRTRKLLDGTLINFGVSYPCDALSKYEGRIINEPGAVALAVNKLRTFEALRAAGVPTLTYTTQPWEAMDWLEPGTQKNKVVFARHRLSGRSGQGIELLNEPWMISESKAKLFTLNFPKTREYRVNVVGDTVVSIAQKRAMQGDKLTDMGLLEANRKVRTYKNGWVFSVNNVEGPVDTVSDVAIQAVRALGLDFGGVDVLASASDEVRVCEVNTAPGLKGETNQAQFFEAIQAYI